MSYTIGRMRLVNGAGGRIAGQARALHRVRRGRSATAAVAAAALIIVLLVTVLIARSLVGPLRQLKAGASTSRKPGCPPKSMS